ncbi:MAG: GNAT family N-acetyltransferase [Alphaproteobacteria bacterium]|jgi:GNAT superfamily N-acetyltransferase|nr:GNAT family N-acetyltransferase [Alphaproteobacteria bacterium]
MSDHAAPLVRDAEEADRDGLSAIMDATWRDTWASHLPLEADRTWREGGIAAMFIGRVWAFCLVAEIDGQIAGFAHLSSNEVTSLHVDRTIKRRGVGRALMAAAEPRMRALGHGRLRIETELFNTPAHAFYGALGDTETRRFIGDVIGHDVPCMEMSKSL